MVKRKRIFLIVCVVLAVVLILAGASYFLFFSESNIFGNEETFSVKTFLLKINMPLGGEYTSNIKIQNNEPSEKHFSISLSNPENIIASYDKELLLGANEGTDISLEFRDNGLDVGVYPSELIISDGKFTKKIPVIVTVEDNKKLFSIIYSDIPQYQNVYPGGKFGIDIKVYDLDAVKSDTVKARFYIQNLDGDILWSDVEDLVIEGSKTNIVPIPENWPKGHYVFVTLIEYEGIKSISGYVFDISKKEITFFQSFNSNLLILISLGFIFAFIFLIIYLIKSRDEFLITLKKQQNSELAKNLKLIKYSKKKIQEIPKQTSVEKKRKIQKLDKIKKKIIGRIKKKQKTQKRELKKLKKHHKKNEIKSKLSSWKNEGYKMFETEHEINKVANLKKQIKDWKNQGYKI